MLEKAFKVVRKIDGRFVSANSNIPDSVCLDYGLGVLTIPKVANSYIFAFERLSDAERFAKLMNCRHILVGYGDALDWVINYVLNDEFISYGKGVFDAFWGRYGEGENPIYDIRSVFSKDADTFYDSVHLDGYGVVPVMLGFGMSSLLMRWFIPHKILEVVDV